jgi:hypothetical protein
MILMQASVVMLDEYCMTVKGMQGKISFKHINTANREGFITAAVDFFFSSNKVICKKKLIAH